MTSPSSANTTAEKNAERVRNSIERSLRAMSHAAERMSAIRRQRLAVCGCIGAGVDAVGGIVAQELPALHHRRVRREREAFGEIVRHHNDRGPGRAQLTEKRRESAGAAFVEAAVRLVGQHKLRGM